MQIPLRQQMSISTFCSLLIELSFDLDVQVSFAIACAWKDKVNSPVRLATANADRAKSDGLVIGMQCRSSAQLHGDGPLEH